MTLIDRYILRQLRGAFLLVLGVLTGVVWLTSSLRQLELLVSQGQTIVIFLGITLLAVPLLIQLIAPFALFIAFLFVLNKLNTDSELIVMSAAGLSQHRLLRPVLILSVAVALLGYALSLGIVPATLRQLREAITAARADFISQVIQPGRFTTVDNGLTIHVRDRASNGLLLGVFVNDTRDSDVDMTYLGARGVITKTDNGTFLVLEQGQIVRKPKTGTASGSVISFESYALNLSAFVGAGTAPQFPAQERWTSELVEQLNGGETDQRVVGRLRSELHDRFASPLYSLAFALVAFAALGRARTTRQSRSESVALAIGVVVLLRIGGFFASGLAQRQPAAVALIYLAPVAGIVLSLMLALRSGPRRGGSTLNLAGLLAPLLPARLRFGRG